MKNASWQGKCSARGPHQIIIQRLVQARSKVYLAAERGWSRVVTISSRKCSVAFAVALRVESVRPVTPIMPMAVPETVGGSIPMVKRLFFLVFLQFLHLPIVIPERFVHVMRLADDWAEFHIVLLCDP